MSNDESDVTDFLQRIVRSLSAGLGWLFINMTAGIYAGYMFFDRRPGIGNIIFYIWLLASLCVLLWYLHRTWKKRFPLG